MLTPKRPKYNYDALERLQHYQKHFDGLHRTHHYATTLRMNRLLFRAAEKTFLSEIKRLDRKIVQQMKARNAGYKETQC
jgi:hypothetical protein